MDGWLTGLGAKRIGLRREPAGVQGGLGEAPAHRGVREDVSARLGGAPGVDREVT